MSVKIDEYVKTELKDVAKKLLIESVDINKVYKAFSKLSKSEIDEIELEAAEGRRKRINRECFEMYFEEHKDDLDDIVVKIYNDAVEEGKREFEMQVIKNLKKDNVPVVKIQKIFTKYTTEEIEEI